MLAEVGGGLGWIELEVETSEWHREVVCDILMRAEAVAQSASQPFARLPQRAKTARRGLWSRSEGWGTHFEGKSRFQKLRVGDPPT